MNALKKSLVAYLQENARYSVEQLAKMTGESVETVARYINELEADGIIVKYSAIINSEKLDENEVKAMIDVKVAPQKLKGFDALAEQISAFREVESVFLMSGGYDLSVVIKGKNLNEVAKFISEKISIVDGVLSVATHFILKKYKIEGQITSPKSDSDRQIIL